MTMRVALSIVFALAAGASFSIAYAIAAQQHFIAWVAAIVILEPIGLFSAIAAPLVLFPRLGFLEWLRSTVTR
jgi:hypothetical protein